MQPNCDILYFVFNVVKLYIVAEKKIFNLCYCLKDV